MTKFADFKIKISFILPVIYTISLATPVAFAANCTQSNGFDQCTDFSPPPGARFTSQAGLVGQILTEIIPLVLGIAGFLTVIMIVVSGIQFITSSGNPEAAGAARSRLMYALIGFIIIVLSFAILQFINTVFLKTSIV